MVVAVAGARSVCLSSSQRYSDAGGVATLEIVVVGQERRAGRNIAWAS